MLQDSDDDDDDSHVTLMLRIFMILFEKNVAK